MLDQLEKRTCHLVLSICLSIGLFVSASSANTKQSLIPATKVGFSFQNIPAEGFLAVFSEVYKTEIVGVDKAVGYAISTSNQNLAANVLFDKALTCLGLGYEVIENHIELFDKGEAFLEESCERLTGEPILVSHIEKTMVIQPAPEKTRF